jgi:hypothetical protein
MGFLKVTKTKRNWQEIIMWSEIRRVPYNIMMYLIGILSFQIGYVTIPVVYLIVGLCLNALYTFGWIVELLVVSKLKEKETLINYPAYAFVSYLTFSTIVVFAIAISLLIG